jgi:hypothetical protein
LLKKLSEKKKESVTTFPDFDKVRNLCPVVNNLSGDPVDWKNYYPEHPEKKQV